VQQVARDANRLFALSLAAEGTATIGGNLATNAGGVSVLRYGMARDQCLGLEVVTADGDVWDGLRGLRKDNTGYDLRDLFIGSEGTLGIITAAVLRLHPLPTARTVALVAVAGPRQAMELFAIARSTSSATLTAFELLNATSVEMVVHSHDGFRLPFANPVTPPWTVLFELSDGSAAIEAILQQGVDAGLIIDATIARSESDAQRFWMIRESISDAQAAAGPTIKHDISVPVSRVAAFIDDAEQAVRRAHPDVRFVVFGHAGDGNIHENFSPIAGGDHDVFRGKLDDLNRIVHDVVRTHHGSISAEHGLGVLRRDEADRYRSPVERTLMRVIKTALDPNGILNPHKVLPDSR
jgi:FAD/FMN-containing dehydrogenase